MLETRASPPERALKVVALPRGLSRPPRSQAWSGPTQHLPTSDLPRFDGTVHVKPHFREQETSYITKGLEANLGENQLIDE